MFRFLAVALFLCMSYPAHAGAFTKQLACIIRNDGSGWAFVTSPPHRGENCGTIVAQDETLVLTYATPMTAIGAVVVSADETLAQRGIVCGASVDTRAARIKCNRPLVDLIGKWANLFVIGLFD